jgi:ATP-binding cassette subfamily B protein
MSTARGLRGPEVRQGFELLARTLRGYPRVAILSVVGALLWMALVVAIPYVVARIVDDAILAGNREPLVPLVAVLVLAGALQAVGIGMRRYFGFNLSYRAEADLRNRLFAHMQRLAFTFHDETTTGQLMARASSDLSQVRLILAMLPITVANLAMFVVVVVVLIVIDPVLGLVSALTVPALFFTANRYAGKVIGLSFRVQENLADVTTVVEEAVGGIEVVKAYGQEDQEQARLERAARSIFDDTIAIARKSATYSPLFELIPSLGTLAVLWLGGMRVIDGEMTLGAFVAFTQYLAVLVLPLMITGWFFANVPRSAAAATRIEELLRTDPEILDPPDPIRLPAGPGAVRFENASFSYPGGERVLHAVNLTIPGGEAVALVGSTGSGKTTLANLIPRFYDVNEGAVSIDGINVRDLALEDLRNEVAVVFQETFLFSASIRDNILLGDPAASDRSIRAAARLAQAHDFVCALPDGYDTMVGERGHTLSGGQRQRIALARSVLRDPRVLILDDATSSVDAVVEAEIQSALRHVMDGRTTVIIAHRTSTLALVDTVVFIDGGRIMAVGTHQELLAAIPRYGAVLASDDAFAEGAA